LGAPPTPKKGGEKKKEITVGKEKWGVLGPVHELGGPKKLFEHPSHLKNGKAPGRGEVFGKRVMGGMKKPKRLRGETTQHVQRGKRVFHLLVGTDGKKAQKRPSGRKKRPPVPSGP